MSRNRVIAFLVLCNVLLLGTVAWRELNLAPRAQAAQVTSAATKSGQRRTEIVDAAERMAPSIVSVGASQTGYVISPFANFFNEYTVFPYQERIPYLGSGVIVDPGGLIVTNYHVVQDAKDIFVTLMDGREMPAKLLDADMLLDIALIKIDAKDLPSAKLGDSSDLMVGEWALAMGNPFGNLIGDPKPTVTVGVISAVNRSFRPTSENQRVYLDMIQTDAAINPGNSGGALINSAGELVGINTFIMSRSGGAEGIGFAIPVNRVKTVIEEILMHGHIRSRLMDFQVQNVTERVAKVVGSKAAQGAVVSQVAPGGPAQKAGFQVGDIITSVNGRTIKDAQDFTLIVWTQPVGTKISCEVERNGKTRTIDYELAESKER